MINTKIENQMSKILMISFSRYFNNKKQKILSFRIKSFFKPQTL